MLAFKQEHHVIERSDAGATCARDAGGAAFDVRRPALSALLGIVNHTAPWYGPSGRLRPDVIAAG